MLILSKALRFGDRSVVAEADKNRLAVRRFGVALEEGFA